MGKKNRRSGGGGGGNGGDEKGKVAAAVFGLRVAMHCRCNGCAGKIRSGVQELRLLDGVEAVDRSALEAKGEVTLLATADPERLRQRLHRATGKKVDLLLPKAEAVAKPAPDKKQADDLAAAANAAAAQALLLNHLNLPAQYGGGGGGQGAWAAQLLAPAGVGAAGGYAPAAQAYPWGAVQPAAEAAYLYPSSQPAWGPYASYPPPLVHGHGVVHGGSPAWHGYGYYD